MDFLFPFGATTDGIAVRVAVTFLADQSDPARDNWMWGYHIRIENQGKVAVQLLNRHWRIVDGAGKLTKVSGEGVIGEQPVIAPGGSYDYVSGCPLSVPGGYMVGHYEMADGDDRRFLVDIPRFPLVAPATAS